MEDYRRVLKAQVCVPFVCPEAHAHTGILEAFCSHG